MPRPRLHKDDAARQRACRQKLKETSVLVDRKALTHLESRLETLRLTIYEAASAGDSFALRCRAASVDTMLDRLIVAFHNKASPGNAP